MISVGGEISDATRYPIANAAAVAFIVRSLNDFVTQFSTSAHECARVRVRVCVCLCFDRRC